jgi:hypothetical protein
MPTRLPSVSGQLKIISRYFLAKVKEIPSTGYTEPDRTIMEPHREQIRK